MTNTKPKLGPIVIGVNSIDAVLDFYTNVFEIVVETRKPNYLAARLGDAEIEIEEDCAQRFPHWKERNVGTYKCAEFTVPDMAAFLQKVEKFGGKVVSPITSRPWGALAAEISDPDGNIFLLSQPLNK